MLGTWWVVLNMEDTFILVKLVNSSSKGSSHALISRHIEPNNGIKTTLNQNLWWLLFG
jgi:hypothetical protein